MAAWSQNDAFARDVPEKSRPRECRWIQPILDRNGNRLNHDPGIQICVVGKFSQHHQCSPVVATLVQDQGDIRITVGAVLSARARTKKNGSIQPNIGGIRARKSRTAVLRHR
jgi:hypothetical protein